MNNISITPGKNNIGAYIDNVNLNNLKDSPIKQIKETLAKYGVIFIKKQNLDSENYQNFAKKFGELVAYPRLKGLENYPYINAIIRKPDDKNLTFGGSFFHNDNPYSGKDRPKFTMLYGIEIPAGQGNTIFSSGFNAYKKLPNDIKEKIKNAIGVFSSEGPISITRIEREREMGIKSAKKMEAEHPVIQTVNGKKSLYVSPGHLIKIKNVNEQESEKLKKYLIDHINKDEFIFSYEWNKGDIILWNNLAVMHKASEIKNCKRVMHRITIK
tara:strand:+ start:82 stop:891 length:810 start_codon:yes stop_codon:yes gene_type:complete